VGVQFSSACTDTELTNGSCAAVGSSGDGAVSSRSAPGTLGCRSDLPVSAGVRSDLALLSPRGSMGLVSNASWVARMDVPDIPPVDLPPARLPAGELSASTQEPQDEELGTTDRSEPPKGAALKEAYRLRDGLRDSVERHRQEQDLLLSRFLDRLGRLPHTQGQLSERDYTMCQASKRVDSIERLPALSETFEHKSRASEASAGAGKLHMEEKHIPVFVPDTADKLVETAQHMHSGTQSHAPRRTGSFRAALTWDEDPEDAEEDAGHFCGRWVDRSQMFYGGSTITITDMQWFPEKAPLELQRSSVYTHTKLSPACWCLHEERVDGTRRDFEVRQNADGTLFVQCRPVSPPTPTSVRSPSSSRSKTAMSLVFTTNTYILHRETPKKPGPLRFMSDTTPFQRFSAHSPFVDLLVALNFTYMMRCLKWWCSLQEPARDSPLSRFACSKTFDMTCFTVILLNFIFLIYTADYELNHTSQGFPNTFSFVAQHAFLVFYTAELSVRLAVHKAYFFVNKDMYWNMFDLLLVLLAAMDVLAQDISQHAMNLSYFRAWRAVKLGHVFRMFRAARFVDELRTMMDCIKGSLCAVLWSMVILTCMMCFFALLLVQIIAGHLAVTGISLSADPEMEEVFGSVQQCMLSLFQASTSGEDWSQQYEVIKRTGYLGPALYICFIFFFAVAFWNIMTGHIIEKALKLAQPDNESLMLERRRRDLGHALELVRLMRELDIDQDGCISEEEFRLFIQDESCSAFLDSRGLVIQDAQMFFEMLASCTDNCLVDIESFVWGCMRMRGEAMSIDLHALTFQTRLMHRTQQQFYAHSMEVLEKIAQAQTTGRAAPRRTSHGRADLGPDVFRREATWEEQMRLEREKAGLPPQRDSHVATSHPIQNQR